ncbi:hypothetical protein KUH03_31275 [Sphingobacterium sp. E70]|nr:hypothetical protein [Sphingobacterium sp. E70]ULT23616.1 hypothetical protein KUH03_31275 [Sphingobacterium sp. E70]
MWIADCFAQSGTLLVQELEGRISKQLQELTQMNKQEPQQETRHKKP